MAQWRSVEVTHSENRTKNGVDVEGIIPPKAGLVGVR
jgi:hypothetical protein